MFISVTFIEGGLYIGIWQLLHILFDFSITGECSQQLPRGRPNWGREGESIDYYCRAWMVLILTKLTSLMGSEIMI